MPGQFDLQPNFPIAGVADLIANRSYKEAQMRSQQQAQLVEGLKGFGQGVQSLVDRRNAMAQSLALGQVLNVPEAQASRMTPSQTMEAGKATMPITIPYMDKDGNVQIITANRGSKGIPSAGASALPQQTPYLDENTNMPLSLDRKTNTLVPVKVPGGVKPVLKRGDESAVGDATLLANQIPNIKVMFDAYRNSKSPRLQSTVAGRLMDPSGKQAESSLKLAAFTFGGKNLTGQEKDVIFTALFPSVTDDDQSRNAKEALLTNYMTGKIDLMQAANLLGPAGNKMREVLSKYQGQKTQAAPAQARPEPLSDLVHLSTKELMDLRKKMTAHKEDNGSKPK